MSLYPYVDSSSPPSRAATSPADDAPRSRYLALEPRADRWTDTMAQCARGRKTCHQVANLDLANIGIRARLLRFVLDEPPVRTMDVTLGWVAENGRAGWALPCPAESPATGRVLDAALDMFTRNPWRRNGLVQLDPPPTLHSRAEASGHLERQRCPNHSCLQQRLPTFFLLVDHLAVGGWLRGAGCEYWELPVGVDRGEGVRILLVLGAVNVPLEISGDIPSRRDSLYGRL